MVDDGRTTDGRTTEHGYTISSPCEPDGSGELKTPKHEKDIYSKPKVTYTIFVGSFFGYRLFIKCLICIEVRSITHEVSEILRILMTECCRTSLQNMQGVKITFFQITSLLKRYCSFMN